MPELVGMIDKIVNMVKKIEGDIDINKQLREYTKQTDVFVTKVKKNESN
jgi:hypothetical protein